MTEISKAGKNRYFRNQALLATHIDKFCKELGMEQNTNYSPNVEILVLWLRHNLNWLYPNLKELNMDLRSADKTQAIVSKVISLGRRGEPCFFNTAYYTPEKPTTQEVLEAIQLVVGIHPFSRVIASICDKYKSANAIVLCELNKLDGSLPCSCTTVANLIQSLGYFYITDQPYEEQGVILGRISEEYLIAYTGFTLSNYKIGNAESLAQLIKLGVISEPLTYEQSYEFGLQESKNSRR